MNDDIQPSQPQSAPPQQPVQQPAPQQPVMQYPANNQVYGQTQANVQPTMVNPIAQPLPQSPQQPGAYAAVEQAKPKKEKQKKLFPTIPPGLKGFLGTLELLAGAILIAFCINAFVFQSYEVVGQSMYPTLNNGDRLIISKFGKTWSSVFGDTYIPSRGDIIVFKDPVGQQKQLIKRVIGLPGEKVIVKDGNITIINDANPNGFDPDADYKDTLPPDTQNEKTVDVPAGHIFVSGDNRTGGSSLDSRNELGTVPVDNVVGTLKMRIMPFSTAKLF